MTSDECTREIAREQLTITRDCMQAHPSRDCAMNDAADALLARAIENLSARIRRLTNARDKAKADYDEAALDAAGQPDQHSRRAARTANEALRGHLIAKQAELDAEQAALATAQRRLTDQRQVRDAAELAARVEAERLACAGAAQKVHDACADFDAALARLAVSREHLAGVIVALFAVVPANLKPDCAPVLGKGAIDGRAMQSLVDHGVLPGRHTNDDATAPKARMLALFERSPKLRSLLPAPTAETECAT